MNKLSFCFAFALLAPACNSDNLLGGMSDMTVPPDLLISADMTMRVPDGVQCNGAACLSPKVCCITPNAAGTGATEACVAAGSCGDGGVSEACDGPEDCGSATPDCCATASFTVGTMDMGGFTPKAAMAACLSDAACPASATIVGSDGSINTKLCHTAADCLNYSGTAPIIGTADFSACCSAPMAPDLHFCAPTLLTTIIKGATCN